MHAFSEVIEHWFLYPEQLQRNNLKNRTAMLTPCRPWPRQSSDWR